MKTMTCNQLGGPCGSPAAGERRERRDQGAGSASEKGAVAGGDETHRVALDEMKGRWKRPIAGMGWYRKVKRDFAAWPEDN